MNDYFFWIMQAFWGLLFLTVLIFALSRVLRSPMTDAAKGIWVLVIFLIPIFGVLLVFAYVPKPIEDDAPVSR